MKDDEEARQEFVDLLEVLGPDDPRTARLPQAAHRPPVLTRRSPVRRCAGVRLERHDGYWLLVGAAAPGRGGHDVWGR